MTQNVTQLEAYERLKAFIRNVTGVVGGSVELLLDEAVTKATRDSASEERVQFHQTGEKR